MLTPISGAYGSEPSLVRGDVSLREEGVNANRKRINTPVHAQAKALSSKAPGNKASVGMKNFSAFLHIPGTGLRLFHCWDVLCQG